MNEWMDGWMNKQTNYLLEELNEPKSPTQWAQSKLLLL